MTTIAPASAGLITNRPRYTRWLVIVLWPIIALSSPPADRPEWLLDVFESLGLSQSTEGGAQ